MMAEVLCAHSSSPRPRRRLTLALKFALAFIAVVSLVLLVNGAVNVWLAYGEAKSSAIRVQKEKAQAAAERIDLFVAEIEQQIGWTTRVEWARVPIDQRRYDFIRLLRQAPAITEIIHVDGTGKEELKLSRLEPDVVDGPTSYVDDPRFKGALDKKIWFGPVTFRRGSEPYMTIALVHAGRTPGVTIAEVNLKLIWDVLTGIKIGERGYAFIVDAKGNLVAHPDMSLVLRETNLSRLPQVAAALSGTTGKDATATDAVGLDGTSVLVANAPISRLQWQVFVQLPTTEALAPVYAALTQTLALLALGLLLATIMGWFLAQRLVVPIQRLQLGAERLGAGDLDQRIDIKTGDEIETLGERFNDMAARLKESYATLEGRVEERTADLNEALEQQTATAEVLKVISRSPSDLQPVLDAIAETAARLCGSEQTMFFRFDGAVFQILASWNFPTEVRAMLERRPIAPGHPSAMGRAGAELTPVYIPDVLENPDYGLTGEQAKARYRATLAVPMLREGKLIGALSLNRSEPDSFTDKHIDLVRTFADQAVIAIENVRLFEEVQARTAEIQEALKQQTATADVLKVISRSAFDVNAVLNALLETAARLCGASICILFRRDGELLRVAASYGGTPGFTAYLAAHPHRIERANVAGRAALERRTVHIADISEDVEYAIPQSIALGGWRSIIGVPLLRDGEVIGVLDLARPNPGPFAARQIEFVESFADQAVIAIENSRLFEEVQARTVEIEEALVYQTGSANILKVIASSPTDVTPVLKAIIDTACEVCEANDAAVLLQDGADLRFSAHRGPITIGLEKWPINRHWTAGRAFVDRAPVHVHDLLSDEGLEYPDGRDLAVRMGHRTILSVPLLREGVSIGAIVVRRTEVQSFTDKQIGLLQTFADQAVIAIGNVHLFDEVQAKTQELQASLEELKAAQDRLIQSEKLASLGQLTAGIAHEIKNPLNFINNFAALSGELLDELGEVLEPAPLDEKTREEVSELSDMLKGNLAKVVQHGKRADSIVKNMLLHSREGSGEHRAVDVNSLVEESVNLAYHGARAEKPGFNITLIKNLATDAGEADLYPQEITRVFLNLITNGFYAATKRKVEANGGAFEPTLSAATRNLGDRVEIKIRDNGTGIPDEVKEKMFNPFFTTKPAGEGTGLGLSLSFDIVVKQHGGIIDVETVPGEFTEFTITLPRDAAARQTLEMKP